MPVEPVSFGQGGPPGGPVRQDAPARALLLAAGNRKGTQGRVRGLKVPRFDSVGPASFNPPQKEARRAVATRSPVAHEPADDRLRQVGMKERGEKPFGRGRLTPERQPVQAREPESGGKARPFGAEGLENSGDSLRLSALARRAAPEREPNGLAEMPQAETLEILLVRHPGRARHSAPLGGSTPRASKIS
jgi:hypothetical protein